MIQHFHEYARNESAINKDIIFWGMSGISFIEDQIDAFQSGMHLFSPKPFIGHTIKSLINSCSSSRELILEEFLSENNQSDRLLSFKDFSQFI
jgi:hypothetical protein